MDIHIYSNNYIFILPSYIHKEKWANQFALKEIVEVSIKEKLVVERNKQKLP